MTTEIIDTFRKQEQGDEIADVRDEVLQSYNAVTQAHDLNARRKIEDYFAEKALLDQLEDVFTEDLA